MIKPLLVGQAPGRTSGGKVLGGACGRRLALLCGLSLPEFLAAFDRRNVLDSWPGSGRGGDLFPLSQARVAAERISILLPGRSTVVLGLMTAKAIDPWLDGWLSCAPPLTWATRGLTRIAWCPHPSGRNLWWNDLENVERARPFFAALAQEALDALAQIH